MPHAYFVKADTGIERIEDLRGKRVVVDLKGNVSLAALNWAILATAGLEREDIIPVAVGGIEQGVDAVTEGRADAAPVGIGIPLLRKAHAGIPGGVRVVALGRMGTDELLEARAPGSRTFRLQPSPAYVGVSQTTWVAAFDTFINVGSSISADDAYLLAETLHRNWESLQRDYPALSAVSSHELAPATDPHPYSEGAVRYFKDAGIWTEANDQQQAKVSSTRR
jgi:TRAP transporter TAXI family solute receptor